MNKERIKGIAIGLILCAILSADVTAAANSQTVTREITYGVNLMLHGQIIHFDEDSRPFMIDGRTFLPVRAIADAIGLQVGFDPETNTVILGDQPVPTPAPTPAPTPVPTPQPAAPANDWSLIVGEWPIGLVSIGTAGPSWTMTLNITNIADSTVTANGILTRPGVGGSQETLSFDGVFNYSLRTVTRTIDGVSVEQLIITVGSGSIRDRFGFNPHMSARCFLTITFNQATPERVSISVR